MNECVSAVPESSSSTQAMVEKLPQEPATIAISISNPVSGSAVIVV